MEQVAQGCGRVWGRWVVGRRLVDGKADVGGRCLRGVKIVFTLRETEGELHVSDR